MKFGKEFSVGGGSQNHLKIADKQSVIGVFRGEPLEFSSKWVGNKSVACDENDPDARDRFKINFVTKTPDGQYQPLVWEQGPVVYNTLKDLNVDYPLEQTIVKITRRGTGKDTEYSILPIPNNKVTPQLEQLLAAVKLNELTVAAATVESEDSFAPPSGGNGAFKQEHEELPF